MSVCTLFVVPITVIIYNSNTLKNGTEYLFKVEAFDPYDMFRGNYLNIKFKENTAGFIELNTGNGDMIKRKYYVTINVAEDGFAYFSAAGVKKPEYTSNYYKTTGFMTQENMVMIDTPSRYYMNEEKSSAAEDIYRENINNAYVKVRVKNGKMSIVGVYVNNILIDTID